MLVEAEQVVAAHRYTVIAEAGADVADGDQGSAVIDHLPRGVDVVVAECGADGRRVRLSSPAGWIDADVLERAAELPAPKMDYKLFLENHGKLAPGDTYGLEFPFTIEQLREFGAPFLTKAFRASGAIAADNEVTQIVALDRLASMGASEGAFLTVAYAKSEPGLQTRLFAKFPPNKGDEFKYNLVAMVKGEVEMQRLTRAVDLPFATAKYYFGDYNSVTSNYVLITERINYNVAPIEPAYRKGFDHVIPEVEEHYLLMAKALASMVAAHKTGALGHDVESTFPFARAARDFEPIEAAETSVDRLVDFVGRIAPQLFVAGASDPAFLRQWCDDMLFGLANKDAVIRYLHQDVDYTGLCHPNLNLDNAWFWRDDAKELHVGLIDWGGAGQMSIAQAMSGMLMMPIPEDYLTLQRRVIATFIKEYENRGGLRLDEKTLMFQYKASVFSTAICTIVAFVVDMLFKFSEEEYRSMKDRHDDRLLDSGLYAAIVWIDNMLRDWQDELTPGDACRQIVTQDQAAN